MQIKNTKSQYGIIAILMHWLIAILIIGLLVLGIYMTGLAFSAWKLKLYGWHKEFGALVLALAIVRIAWYFANLTPSLPLYLPAWQKIAAKGVHFVLYLFMFAMPLTGWAISSAAGLPVSFFGLFLLPDFVYPNEELRLLFTAVHKWLGYSLIAVICVHIGAVFQHYLIYKDNLLRRMWP